jgi:hypothetical protein
LRALISASNAPGVRDLIDSYYDIAAVQGFALGVHGNFISMYRNEFGKSFSVNEILDSGKVPKGWAETCLQTQLPISLSPIYIVIYVTMAPDDFRNQYQVPNITSVGNYLITIETKGPFIAQADRSRHRPTIKGGISVSNASLNVAGTLGGFVKEIATSDIYLLSCNHVLCDSGGTAIVQQGSSDGGISPTDKVARMTHAVPLTLPTGFTFSSPFNSVDAALGKVDTSHVSVNSNVRIVGPITGTVAKAQMQLGDDVVFVGKEADRQEARIYRFISRLKITIPGTGSGTVYNFGEVFEIEPRVYMYVGSLSKPGDSGSWVVQEVDPQNNNLCGVLIAGTKQFSICCFIETVMDELNNLGTASFNLA